MFLLLTPLQPILKPVPYLFHLKGLRIIVSVFIVPFFQSKLFFICQKRHFFGIPFD